jgi:hypothetical protein
MSDSECVIGPEVTLIYWKDGFWYADGVPFISDISKCKILPSYKDRKILLSVAEPPKAKKKVEYFPPPPPPPPSPPITPPITPVTESAVEEIAVVAQETLIEKLVDKIDSPVLAVLMAVGFSLLKKTMEKNQSKAQEEMDKKCSGRHGGSDSRIVELEDKLSNMKTLLEELSSQIEWEKPNHATKTDLRKLQDKILLIEEKLRDEDTDE